MRVFDNVRNSLRKMNVAIRKMVPMTEMQAVMRSIKIRLATWLFARGPMVDYGLS